MNLAYLLAAGEHFRHQHQMQSTITTANPQQAVPEVSMIANVPGHSWKLFIVDDIDMPHSSKKEGTSSASSFFSREQEWSVSTTLHSSQQVVIRAQTYLMDPIQHALCAFGSVDQHFRTTSLQGRQIKYKGKTIRSGRGVTHCHISFHHFGQQQAHAVTYLFRGIAKVATCNALLLPVWLSLG
jgi:hypothetical protein